MAGAMGSVVHKIRESLSSHPGERSLGGQTKAGKWQVRKGLCYASSTKSSLVLTTPNWSSVTCTHMQHRLWHSASFVKCEGHRIVSILAGLLCKHSGMVLELCEWKHTHVIRLFYLSFHTALSLKHILRVQASQEKPGVWQGRGNWQKLGRFPDSQVRLLRGYRGHQ